MTIVKVMVMVISMVLVMLMIIRGKKQSSPWQWYDGEYGDHEYDEAMQNIIIVGTLLMALVMSLKKVVDEDSEGKLGWYWTMEVT